MAADDVDDRLIRVPAVIERHVGDVIAIVGLVGSPAVKGAHRPGRPDSHRVRIGLGAVVVGDEDRVLGPSFLRAVNAVGSGDDDALGGRVEDGGAAVGVVRLVAVEEQLSLGPGRQGRAPVGGRSDGFGHSGRIGRAGAVPIALSGRRSLLGEIIGRIGIQGPGGGHALVRPVVHHVLVGLVTHLGRRSFLGDRLGALTEAGGRGHRCRGRAGRCTSGLCGLGSMGRGGQWRQRKKPCYR